MNDVDLIRFYRYLSCENAPMKPPTTIKDINPADVSTLKIDPFVSSILSLDSSANTFRAPNARASQMLPSVGLASTTEDIETKSKQSPKGSSRLQRSSSERIKVLFVALIRFSTVIL